MQLLILHLSFSSSLIRPEVLSYAACLDNAVFAAIREQLKRGSPLLLKLPVLLLQVELQVTQHHGIHQDYTGKRLP
jgi:hypothetical protein